MKTFLIYLFFLTLLSISYAKQIVNVGGYQFAPFVEVVQKNKAVGLTIGLIDALNKIQDKYEFKFFLTSPKRRYADFQKNKYDLILFESIDWGWEDFPVDASDIFLHGGAVYITARTPGRDQSYFDDFTGKTIIGMRGYHYKFADFNTDENFLQKRYNVTLTDNNIATIRNVIKKHVDIGVVTLSYLNLYLKNNKADQRKILISDKLDQVYNHTILVRKNVSPSIQEINEFLKQLNNSSKMQELADKYRANFYN